MVLVKMFMEIDPLPMRGSLVITLVMISSFWREVSPTEQLRQSPRLCNIPNFRFGMLYIGHPCISYFIAFSFCDPRNSKQLKDPRRELRISCFSYLNFIKYWNEDFGFNYFSLRKYFILKYTRGDHMNSPKWLKYLRKNIKIKYLILFGFYCYFICIRKIACF